MRHDSRRLSRIAPTLHFRLALFALAAPALIGLGCAASGAAYTPSVEAGTDAPVVLSEDAGIPVVTALPSPFFQGCTPSAADGGGSCPSGLICFGGHTAPPDVHGECTVACTGDNGALCAVNGGTCVCPLIGGAPGNCSSGNDAGAVTVCVPAPDAGTASAGSDGEDAGVVTDAASATSKDATSG